MAELSHMRFPAALLFTLRLFFLSVVDCIGCRSVSCEEMGFDYFLRSVSIPVCIHAFIIRVYFPVDSRLRHARIVLPADLHSHGFGMRAFDLFDMDSPDV